MEKEEARKIGINGRNSIPSKERKRRSHEIFMTLIPYLEKAEKIGCYVSFKSEVSTDEILSWCFAHNKEVYVPKVTGKTLRFYKITSLFDLKEGTFGVKEPITDICIETDRLDLMIVPLTAFDKEGNRCGYGKGYYDSILNSCRYKAGLAFLEQEIDSIHCDWYDVQLDKIIAG